MVQAGGDMFVAGKKRQPTAGSSGSAIPAARTGATRASRIAPGRGPRVLHLGRRQRGFVKDGVRYHHILDPRTGQPAHASRSVTIIAKDAFTADVVGEGAVHPGAPGGAQGDASWSRRSADFEAVWVDDQNQVVVTDTIKSAHSSSASRPGI